MDKYIVGITIIGLAAFGMAFMPAITKKTGISYAIIYLLTGVLLFLLFPSVLPDADPAENKELTLHLSELVVIVSVMGTGIKIDRTFSFKNWASPLKLISVAMLICITVASLMGYYLLGLNLAAAVLIGAVLAPTDPVLASDVQVGPPNEQKKSETKFALTAEAGLNDGVAFPFTWLAISLATLAGGKEFNVLNWFGYHLVYQIVAGIIIGYVIGKAVGYLVFRMPEKFKFLKTRDGLLAISLTLLVYGITEMVHAYGFVAVFICAITLRHSEKSHDLHHELHSFTDQIERLLIAVLLLLFGGSLVSGILDSLTWQGVVFSLLFLFIVRPFAAYISLYGADIHWKEKLAISFFGIRGMGSVFYLAFAFSQVHFDKENTIWSVVAFTILMSILIHGITATPIMRHLKHNLPEEEIPA